MHTAFENKQNVHLIIKNNKSKQSCTRVLQDILVHLSNLQRPSSLPSKPFMCQPTITELPSSRCTGKKYLLTNRLNQITMGLRYFLICLQRFHRTKLAFRKTGQLSVIVIWETIWLNQHKQILSLILGHHVLMFQFIEIQLFQTIAVTGT